MEAALPPLAGPACLLSHGPALVKERRHLVLAASCTNDAAVTVKKRGPNSNPKWMYKTGQLPSSISIFYCYCCQLLNLRLQVFLNSTVSKA